MLTNVHFSENSIFTCAYHSQCVPGKKLNWIPRNCFFAVIKNVVLAENQFADPENRPILLLYNNKMTIFHNKFCRKLNNLGRGHYLVYQFFELQIVTGQMVYSTTMVIVYQFQNHLITWSSDQSEFDFKRQILELSFLILENYVLYRMYSLPY